MNPVDLVSRLTSGDETAFDDIYNQYVKLVRYIAYQLARDHADTDDIVQEVFIQVHRSIQDLKNPKQLKAWISRITYSKAKIHFRKKRDKTMNSEIMDILYKKEEVKTAYLPLENNRHQTDLDALNECIASLQSDFREVIVLFYFAQLSIKEIAEVTGKAEGTVKSRLSYAKKNLNKIIKNYEKKNDVKITFHGKSITYLLLFAGTSLTKNRFKIRHVLSTTSTPLTLGVTATIAVSLIGVAAYQANQNDEPFHNVPQSQSLAVQKFEHILYQGQWIKTPRDAYTTLLKWAHCEVELHEKNASEFQEIETVYEQLKNYGQGYYQLLVANDWDKEYRSAKNEIVSSVK